MALALESAGHRIAGVLGRTPGRALAVAREVGSRVLEWPEPLPAADLLIVAVSDDAIEEVAARLAPLAGAVEAAVHLSGLQPVAALNPLAGQGLRVGAFHPLQTLPNPEVGAASLSGAHVAITADDVELRERLEALARSIGAQPFLLDDARRAVYHAAAAAASNFVITALAMAESLFHAARVPFAVAQPLVERIVLNAFVLGPEGALTGPVARGDAGTVRAQLEAVRAAAPHLEPDFRALCRATARLAGTEAQLAELLG